MQFMRVLRAIQHQFHLERSKKQHILGKRTEASGPQRKAGTVTSSRLDKVRICIDAGVPFRQTARCGGRASPTSTTCGLDSSYIV